MKLNNFVVFKGSNTSGSDLTPGKYVYKLVQRQYISGHHCKLKHLDSFELA